MAYAIARPPHRRGSWVAWSAVALVVTLTVGVAVESVAEAGDPAAAGDLAVALAFVVCGVAVWASDRTPDLTGPLMVATGAAWLAGSLSDELVFLHRGPLVQLLVTAPGGRPRTWMEWLVVVAAYVDAIAPGVGREAGATLGLAVVVAGLAFGRWVGARGMQRRARAVAAAAAGVVALALVAGTVATAAEGDVVLWCYEGVLVATAATLFADRRWGGWSQAALTTLAIDLGEAPAGSLGAALARAVGDPSLVVGYGIRDGRYADELGRPVPVPGPAVDRAVTSVEVDGAPAAVLLHDPSALRAPGLSDAVIAAVRLALTNVRLQEDISARLRDVEASRARLLRARDTERRGLETRLRAGVGRRLDAVAAALRELADDPNELISSLPLELDRTRAELGRFAAGLHPRDLERGGLPAALPVLAAEAPLHVDVNAGCGRLDAALEAAAWFVCSEALANVVKHAEAARAAIDLQRRNGWLVVTVEDDGRGGADPSAGHGLRGLAGRVEAAGGSLEIGPRPGGGTRLRATLPVREQA